MKKMIKENWEIIVVVLLVVAAIAFGIYASNEDSSKDKEETKTENKVSKDDTVAFVGDNLIEKYDLSEYKDFKTSKVSEIGLTSTDLLSKLNDIYATKANDVIIYTGIFDIVEGEQDVTVSNLTSVIKNIKKNLKDATIYLVSILPTSKEIGNEYIDAIDQSEITSLNKKLKSLAKDNDINYIDAYSEVVSSSDLNSKYTNDGLNLNEAGYKEITKIINNEI